MLEDEAIIRLRIAGDNLQRELDAALGGMPRRMEQAGNQAGDSFARGLNAKAAAIGAAAASGVLMVQQAIERSLALARDLETSSAELGVGVEKLQEWRFAANQAGMEAAALDNNVQKLTQRIGEANAGNRQAQQTFVDLGIGFQTVDGHARSTEAVFVEIVARLAEIEDPAERARLGAELLGEGFARMEPLVRGGAEGLLAAGDALRDVHGQLTPQQIRNLREAEAAFERMNTTLSVSIAAVVADNADAMIGFASAAETATRSIVGYLEQYNRAFAGNRYTQLFTNPVGAVAGSWLDRWADEGRYAPSVATSSSQAELDRALGRGAYAPTARPTVDPAPARRRSGGGGAPRASAEDREREQAIRAAQRAEEDFERSVQRTLEAQSDSARIEDIRKQQGEASAAAEEARLAFQRQNPLAVHQTVEALGEALGKTREQIQAEREKLQLMIDQADVAERVAASAAEEAQAARDSEARKQAEVAAFEKDRDDRKAAADEQRQQQEDALRDLSDLYSDLFMGGNGRIWQDFKKQGLGIMADIAAQWTLALLSGQSGGLGGLAGATGGAGGNPLATIFNMGGGLLGGGAGTKPGVTAGGDLGSVLGGLGGLFGIGRGSASGTGMSQISTSLAAVPGLGEALAITALTVGVGEGIEKLTGLRFDMLGGILGGGIGGFAVGALKGAVKGNATIGANGSSLGIVDSFGKRKFQDQAIGDATGIMDSLAQIAGALGVDLNSGLAAVSIGTRNGKYRVDPTGKGVLKTGQGAVDFGKDQEAAVAYAIRNLIEDGVLGPISEASRNILQRGGDLQQAIEKAVQIESVPKLLKERLDPLGARLEEIDKQFGKLADAMKEGGASAEQIAQARKLWQLEREDAINQIGEASASLKDFLTALNAGSSSPLSLRQQRAEAEKALSPYVASIDQARAAQAEVARLKANGGSVAEIAAAEEAARAAAGAVDQGGFQNAAQVLLGISRQINGSGAGFFADFDRIRGLTGGAIGAIDGATSAPGAGQDPFTAATAQNTADIARILVDTQELLIAAMNDNGNAAVAGGKKWLKQQRKLIGAG